MAQTFSHGFLMQPPCDQFGHKDVRIFLQWYTNMGTFSVSTCLSQNSLMTCPCLLLGWDTPHCFEREPAAGSEGLWRWKVPVPEQVELNQLGTAGIRGAETNWCHSQFQGRKIVLIIFTFWDLEQFSSCRGFFLSTAWGRIIHTFLASPLSLN